MHFPGAAPTILRLRHAATVLSAVGVAVADSLRIHPSDRQRIDESKLVRRWSETGSRSSIPVVLQNAWPARLLHRASTRPGIPVVGGWSTATTGGGAHKRVQIDLSKQTVRAFLALAAAILINQATPTLAQIAPFDDFQHSAKHYAQQAKAGDPVAQLYLGIAIEALGVDAASHYGAARDWIAKAAAAGLPAAQLRLAQIDLVDGDRTNARKHLNAAAVAGLAEAQFNLAVMGQEDGDAATAQRQYEAAARQGFGPAQFNLALMMLADPNGDTPGALAWLILSAEQNTPNAQAARDQVSAALTEDERAEAAQRVKALR